MKTFTAGGRIAALISSPLLLGLYVYDRSGGNLFAPWLVPAATAPATPAPPNVASGSVDPAAFEQVSRYYRERRQPPLEISTPPTTALPMPLAMTSKSAAVDLVTVPQGAGWPSPQVIEEGTPIPVMLPGSKSIVLPLLPEPTQMQASDAQQPPNAYVPQQGANR